MQRLARTLAARSGLVTSPSGIYAVVPASVPPRLDPSWRRRVPLHGIDLRLDRQLHFLNTELAPFIEEFSSELHCGEDGGFELWNGQYMGGDAELLYAMVRHLKPSRVIEIGSGFSTMVSAAACRRNGREGSPAELIAIDPMPRTEIAGLEGLTRIERVDCRSLPASVLTDLDPGDVLFIDSSHVVKLGSEVNLLLLDVLPRLAPGVIVHIHDIYLPYEYHPHLYALGVYFTEQYLLQALLTENDRWEILLSACALTREFPAAVRSVIPSVASDLPGLPADFDYAPAAFWMRRR